MNLYPTYWQRVANRCGDDFHTRTDTLMVFVERTVFTPEDGPAKTSYQSLATGKWFATLGEAVADAMEGVK